jgi:hypothetical protein
MTGLRIVGLALLLSGTATTPALGQYWFGLTGGATYSTLSGDWLTNSQYEWGFMAGGFLAWPFHRHGEVRLEANFVQQGGSGTTAVGAQAADLTIRYLEFPLIFAGTVPLGSKLHGQGYAGIALGIRLSCDATVDAAPKTSCFTSDLAFDPSSSEWSIPFGVAIGIDVGPSRAWLDARYSLGLSSVSKTELRHSKHRTWEFMLRWAFVL